MPDLSLILTYYNESLILEQSVNKIDEFLSNITLKVELIFIDDNSELLESAKKAGLNIILYKNINQVKNELIKFGLHINQENIRKDKQCHF